jgi:hypothetical protein
MSNVDIIDNSPSRAIATTGADPYSAYGAKVGTTGQFLSFKNGEYLYGQNADELKLGTKLIANMPGLRIGWRRWFGGQVTDDLTEPLIDAPPIRSRKDLGDNDQSEWEKDDRGEPRDPWQMTNILDLSDGRETYIYSTGSKGGIGAIGRLCAAYGKERRQRPGMLPIITLGRDFYNHTKFGKTYFPKFEIVGWTDEVSPSVDSDADDDVPFDPAPGQRAENPTKVAASSMTPSGAASQSKKPLF